MDKQDIASEGWVGGNQNTLKHRGHSIPFGKCVAPYWPATRHKTAFYTLKCCLETYQNQNSNLRKICKLIQNSDAYLYCICPFSIVPLPSRFMTPYHSNRLHKGSRESTCLCKSKRRLKSSIFNLSLLRIFLEFLRFPRYPILLQNTLKWYRLLLYPIMVQITAVP